MNCNLQFDFHSPHNNEYWYRCTTCGEKDWFAYYSKPKKTDALRSCKLKQEPKMEDTDWRPSACPECGRLRNAARYPVCENKQCRDFGRGGPDRKPQEETNMSRPRYLWIRPNSVESPMLIIDDPVSIFRGNQFDESVDKLYQIGPEVKLKVVLEPQPSYRLSEEHLKTVRASGYRTPFENSN